MSAAEFCEGVTCSIFGSVVVLIAQWLYRITIRRSGLSVRSLRLASIDRKLSALSGHYSVVQIQALSLYHLFAALSGFIVQISSVAVIIISGTGPHHGAGDHVAYLIATAVLGAAMALIFTQLLTASFFAEALIRPGAVEAHLKATRDRLIAPKA
jgi:hypothetical protein